jgi:hypothetical protein
MLALVFINLVIGLSACDCVLAMLLYMAFAMLPRMEKSLFSDQLLLCLNMYIGLELFNTKMDTAEF